MRPPLDASKQYILSGRFYLALCESLEFSFDGPLSSCCLGPSAVQCNVFLGLIRWHLDIESLPSRRNKHLGDCFLVGVLSLRFKKGNFLNWWAQTRNHLKTGLRQVSSPNFHIWGHLLMLHTAMSPSGLLYSENGCIVGMIINPCTTKSQEGQNEG